MRLIAPCKECKEHAQNCHAVCKKYKVWKIEDDKRKAEYTKKRKEAGIYVSYAKQSRENMRTRRKKKYAY